MYFLHAHFFVAELIEENIETLFRNESKKKIKCTTLLLHHTNESSTETNQRNHDEPKRIEHISCLFSPFGLQNNMHLVCMKNQVLAHEIENSSHEAPEWHSIDKQIEGLTGRRGNGEYMIHTPR